MSKKKTFWDYHGDFIASPCFGLLVIVAIGIVALMMSVD